MTVGCSAFATSLRALARTERQAASRSASFLKVSGHVFIFIEPFGLFHSLPHPLTANSFPKLCLHIYKRNSRGIRRKKNEKNFAGAYSGELGQRSAAL